MSSSYSRPNGLDPAGIVEIRELPPPPVEENTMLSKVFPIELKPGNQAAAEAIVEEFAPIGPAQEGGTLSFRVYRDTHRADYLLFVEHFTDQAAYDTHTGSTAYQQLVAGRFAELVVEFVELDHELLVSN